MKKKIRKSSLKALREPSRNLDFLSGKKNVQDTNKEYSIVKARCPFCRHHKASARITRDTLKCCKCGKYFMEERVMRSRKTSAQEKSD